DDRGPGAAAEPARRLADRPSFLGVDAGQRRAEGVQQEELGVGDHRLGDVVPPEPRAERGQRPAQGLSGAAAGRPSIGPHRRWTEAVIVSVLRSCPGAKAVAPGTRATCCYLL